MSANSDHGPVESWIFAQGLEGASLVDLLDGFATQLSGLGVPLSRAYMALPALNPEIRAFNLTWRREVGVVREDVAHERWPTAFEQSPIAFMMSNDIPRQRWRLADEAERGSFSLLGELHEQGDTDYAAHIVRFGGGATTMLQGVALSVCTDAPEGFRDEDLSLLTSLVPALALAAYRIALSDTMVTVLGAYVGHDAGLRILSGEIRRGQGHRLGAAILFADLRGFTAAADTESETLIGRLGEHLAAIAEPIEEQGGEVLKFMGDGVLAGFAIPDGLVPGTACASALAAAEAALARTRFVNARYPDTPPLDLDVALHRGEVFYGNVGGGHRLDFTVIGPAVNEASRIEALCGRLDRSLLMSAPFASCCGRPVRSLGAHALRGVSEPREIFSLADDES